MKTLAPPQLTCNQITPLDLDNWKSLQPAFRDAQPVGLRQTWLAAPSPHLRPTQVRTAWAKPCLYVYAELEDADIFNPITKFNDPAFTKGDAFEMFLRPMDQATYFEFHVTPFNQKFQLRIPSAERFAAKRKPPGLPNDWFIQDRQIESRARVCVEEERWFVVAAIPFDMVVESETTKAGSRWLFSFSRYDYTRGQAKPVISSSSPHLVANFHRQQEWGTLHFA